MRKETIFTAVAIAVAVAVPAFAADGDLDTTFGDAGTQHVEIGDYEYGAAAHDVVLDGEGRTILVGAADNGDGPEWGLVRLDADGKLDETFGYGGTRTDWIGNGGTPYAADLQDDGKLVVAGDAHGEGTRLNEFAVGRYDENGQFDDAFGEDSGTQRRPVGDVPGGFARAADVQVLSDGDIVVAGFGTWSRDGGEGDEQEAAVVRLNSDGSPDSEFGVQGLIHWAASSYMNRALSVAERPGGGIVVGGMAEQESGRDDLQFAAFTRRGAYDTTFSGDGVLVVPVDETEEGVIESVAVDDEGRIVGAGSIGSGGPPDFLVARLTPQGELDESFGDGGIARDQIDGWSEAHELALRDDGRILVAGTAGDSGFALAQYDEAGQLDPSFGGDGVITTGVDDGEAHALALSADGTRAVLAGRGSSMFAAARYVLDKAPPKDEPEEDDEPKKEQPAQQQQQQQQEQQQQQPPAPQTQPAVVVPRSVVRLPRRCTSRRTFTINLRRLGLVRRDAVFRGKKAKQRRLKGDGRTIRVDLRRLPAGRYAVDIVGVRKGGRKVKLTRRYWTCKGKRGS